MSTQISSFYNPFKGGMFGPLSDIAVPDIPKPESPPDVPQQQPLPNAPDRTDPSTAQAADEAARKAVLDEEATRRKRSNTILTSPLGDQSEAPVTRKTLLGG